MVAMTFPRCELLESRSEKSWRRDIALHKIERNINSNRKD